MIEEELDQAGCGAILCFVGDGDDAVLDAEG